MMFETGGIEKYFRVTSYLVALSGLLALFVTGGVGVFVFTVFVLTAVVAWFLEDSKWQMSERVAVTIVAVSVVLFAVDWRFGLSGMWANGPFAAAGLARLILFLAAVKLLQKKADKDWILIYLISFFEVLLAAGLSISPLYLLSLFVFLLFTTCAIIAFEIRKSSRVDGLPKKTAMKTGIRRLGNKTADEKIPAPVFRLSVASIVLLALITVFGLPIFFSLPRGNAAGFGGDGASPVNVTGFSDSVTLGAIGTLQQSEAIVMRVRIDQNSNKKLDRLLWRGVALDNFDNTKWTKTNPHFRRPYVKKDNNLVLLDYPERTGLVTIQTFYLEPMSTNVLFALRRPFALSGVNVVSKDSEEALIGIRNGSERLSYSVYSDTSLPETDKLRNDAAEYNAGHARYLQLPENLDPRIAALAGKYVSEAKAVNRYDAASAIESGLLGDFSYSLEMKASGEQPIADFLFNIKAGHCEYFASSMAMMLRTQGIASRVVNGFQSGDYNSTAGVYIVRQQHAHSWVEVFFPESNKWVTFDPTPPNNLAGSGSFFASFAGYVEALETFWIQYVVAYDGQEQRSLFRTFRDGLSDYMSTGSGSMASFQALLVSYWEDLRGDKGVVAGFRAAGIGLAVLVLFTVLVFLAILIRRQVAKLKIVEWLRRKLGLVKVPETVEFYNRMGRILEKHGLSRNPWQTPAEFAADIGIQEVISITDAYNRVRFGRVVLEKEENERIQMEMDLIRETFQEKR